MTRSLVRELQLWALKCLLYVVCVRDQQVVVTGHFTPDVSYEIAAMGVEESLIRNWICCVQQSQRGQFIFEETFLKLYFYEKLLWNMNISWKVADKNIKA